MQVGTWNHLLRREIYRMHSDKGLSFWLQVVAMMAEMDIKDNSSSMPL